MSNKAKRQVKHKRSELMIVNPDAAGIDISSTMHQVCVPEDRDANHNRCFSSYTQDLHSIARWLKECNIKTVAMESTGIYWVQLFLLLQEYGFEVILVNAKHIKNIADKKTDVVDARWIMLLHSYGLLTPSYQPDNSTREFREYMRQRESLIQSASKEVLHMQKALEQMNIKVHKVISDILGKSGMAIVEAILKGVYDAKRLAELADPRVKAKKEDIIKSLEGNWSKSQLFILRQSYDLYMFYQSAIAQCDKQVQQYLTDLIKINETDPKVTEATGIEKKKTSIKKKQKNGLGFDPHIYLKEAFGVDITQIPGISSLNAMKLLSELGPCFYTKFDESRNFCSWANLVPNNKISGGKILSSRIGRKKNKIGQVFRLAAYTVSKSNSPIGDFFRRVRSRRSYGQAVVAVANKLAKIFYIMVKNQKEYNADLLKGDNKKLLERQIAYAKRKIQMLENQLAA
jgi:transposase